MICIPSSYLIENFHISYCSSKLKVSKISSQSRRPWNNNTISWRHHKILMIDQQIALAYLSCINGSSKFKTCLNSRFRNSSGSVHMTDVVKIARKVINCFHGGEIRTYVQSTYIRTKLQSTSTSPFSTFLSLTKLTLFSMGEPFHSVELVQCFPQLHHRVVADSTIPGLWRGTPACDTPVISSQITNTVWWLKINIHRPS